MNKKIAFVINLPSKKVYVTNEDIDDIMSAAISGCTYWCQNIEVIGKYHGKQASEQISRYGAIKLYPIEDAPAILTRQRFRNGICKWLISLNNVTCMKQGTRLIDTKAIDDKSADFILQYALFGEIRYS